jgi:hypothetical protein
VRKIGHLKGFPPGNSLQMAESPLSKNRSFEGFPTWEFPSNGGVSPFSNMNGMFHVLRCAIAEGHWCVCEIFPRTSAASCNQVPATTGLARDRAGPRRRVLEAVIAFWGPLGAPRAVKLEIKPCGSLPHLQNIHGTRALEASAYESCLPLGVGKACG